jgi:hypothetical protein
MFYLVLEGIDEICWTLIYWKLCSVHLFFNSHPSPLKQVVPASQNESQEINLHGGRELGGSRVNSQTQNSLKAKFRIFSTGPVQVRHPQPSGALGTQVALLGLQCG